MLIFVNIQKLKLIQMMTYLWKKVKYAKCTNTY